MCRGLPVPSPRQGGCRRLHQFEAAPVDESDLFLWEARKYVSTLRTLGAYLRAYVCAYLLTYVLTEVRTCLLTYVLTVL